MRGRRRPAEAGRGRASSTSGHVRPAPSRSRSIDARAEFAENFLVPALHANALYEGKYPLVSALSRPVIVEHLVASARRHRADAVGHGCTGKGNDQVRFEVSSRDPRARPRRARAGARAGVSTRADCIELAGKWDIPIEATKEKLYSIDENMWGRAIECGVLENPWASPPEEPFTLTRNAEGRARGTARHRRRLRSAACRSRSTARRSDLVALIDELGARGRHLRLGPHRHGREPPRRHQEPRGVRVPGVARARSSRTRTSRASRSNVTSRARSSGSRSASPS